MNKKNIIPVFVPHQGCPHDCVFCNQRKITSVEKKLNREEILSYIDEYISYFKEPENLQIAFFGGSFTAINRDLMIEYLEIAKLYIDKGLVSSVRLSTRPDNISEEILAILKEYKVEVIELGVQSMKDEVLKANEREHTVEAVYKSVDLIKAYGFTLGLQMMTNLYEDSFQDDLETARKIIGLSPDFVRIYPTLTIKDTKLAHLYESGLYRPLSLDESVAQTSAIYKLFKEANIRVIRIGLQATEDLNDQENVLAGPFHPAYRALVESKIYRERIENGLDKKEKVKKLTIYANPKDISDIVGDRGSNRDFLKSHYNLGELSFKPINIDQGKMILDKDGLRIYI